MQDWDLACVATTIAPVLLALALAAIGADKGTSNGSFGLYLGGVGMFLLLSPLFSWVGVIAGAAAFAACLKKNRGGIGFAIFIGIVLGPTLGLKSIQASGATITAFSMFGACYGCLFWLILRPMFLAKADH